MANERRIDRDIRGKSASRSADAAIARLAAHQHGVVARGATAATGIRRWRDRPACGARPAPPGPPGRLRRLSSDRVPLGRLDGRRPRRRPRRRPEPSLCGRALGDPRDTPLHARRDRPSARGAAQDQRPPLATARLRQRDGASCGSRGAGSTTTRQRSPLSSARFSAG